jgi:signal transduction histidine kinase
MEPEKPIYSALFSGFLLGSIGAFLLMQRRMRIVEHRASRRMEEIALVSHEFTNAVTVLLAAGENLQDGLVVSDEALRAQGRIITVQASRMKSLAEEVLLCARSLNLTTHREIKEIAVDDLVEDALCCAAGLLEAKQFVVDRKIQAGLPCINGEMNVLSRCLQNLLINAVKYSGECRWLAIAADLYSPPDTEASEIRISVHDRGIGIAEEELKYVFTPYYRCRRNTTLLISGSGLGLSIAKRDAEAFGGTLSVVSRVGVGSVFTLHLPLRREGSSTPRFG